METKVCRLCLEEGEVLTLITNCKGVLLDLNLINFSIIENLKYTKDPLICKECVEQLNKLAKFKETIKTNETKINCHQKNDSNLLLQSLSSDFDKICRLCLQIGENQFEKNWKDYIRLFLESDIQLVSDIKILTKICPECFILLKDLHLFSTSCVDKEKIIISYFDTKKRCLDSTDLLEVNEIRWSKFFKGLNDDDCAVIDNGLQPGQDKENLENSIVICTDNDFESNNIKKKTENTFLKQIEEDWSSESDNEEKNKLPYQSKSSLANILHLQNSQNQNESLVEEIYIRKCDIKSQVITDEDINNKDLSESSPQEAHFKKIEHQAMPKITKKNYVNIIDSTNLANQSAEQLYLLQLDEISSKDVQHQNYFLEEHRLENDRSMSEKYLQNEKLNNLVSTEHEYVSKSSSEQCFSLEISQHENILKQDISEKNNKSSDLNCIQQENISLKDSSLESKPKSLSKNKKQNNVIVPIDNQNLTENLKENSEKNYKKANKKVSDHFFGAKNHDLNQELSGKSPFTENLPVTPSENVIINESCDLIPNISPTNYTIEFQSPENIKLQEIGSIPISKTDLVNEMKKNFLKDINYRSDSEDKHKKVQWPGDLKVVEELTIILDDWDTDTEAEPCQANLQGKRGVVEILPEKQENSVGFPEIQDAEIGDTFYITENGSFENNKIESTKLSNKTDVGYSSGEEDIIISNSSPVIRKLSLKNIHDLTIKRSTTSDFEMPKKKRIVGEQTVASDTEVKNQVSRITRYNSQKVGTKMESSQEIIETENVCKIDEKCSENSKNLRTNPVTIIRRPTRCHQALETSNDNYTELVPNRKRPRNDKIWEKLTGRKINPESMNNIEKLEDPEMDEMVKNIVLDRLDYNAELEVTEVKQKRRSRKRVKRSGESGVQIICLENASNKKEEEEANEGYHFCKICPYKSKFLVSVKQHMAIHSVLDSVTKYKCRHCTFHTKDEKLFNGHMLSHLEQKLQYCCAKCGFMGRKIRTNNALKKCYILQHCLRSHTNEDGSGIETNFCKITNLESNDHYLECIWCFFQSTDSSDFDSHMEEHKDPNVFNKNVNYALLKCSMCGFITKKKATIENHMKTCQGIKPISGILVPEKSLPLYNCAQCDYATPNRLGLPRHFSKMHKNTLNRTKEKEEGETSDQRLTPDDPIVQPIRKPEQNTFYCCRLCDYKTNKKGRLSSHLAGKHSKNWNECPHCPFESKHTGSYKKHLKTQHNIII